MEIIFVSDFFSDQIVGGAELTSDALLEYCPYNVTKVNSSEVNKKFIDDNKDKFWIFGNFTNTTQDIIFYISKNLKYSIIEFDYKFCNHRSVDLHFAATSQECDCEKTQRGKIITIWFHRSKFNWWMSSKQRELYCQRMSFLGDDSKNKVLSSIFTKRDMGFLNALNQLNIDRGDNFVILDSGSWIKGTQDCIQFAKSNNIKFDLVKNLSRQDLFRKLRQSKGIIFRPKGGDTCPRFVIEAKLLGCEILLNENVQHKDEDWFNKGTKDILKYLQSRPSLFWKKIGELQNEH